jgi:hypothetical protein
MAKKLSTALAQEHEVGVKVKGPARMASKPSKHLGVLVGGIVVENGVDQLAGRHGRLDPVQKPDEFLVAMALHALPDHGAVEHIERREQGGRAHVFPAKEGVTQSRRKLKFGDHS